MATVQSESVFATSPDGASQPDSITVGNGSLWVEYGNGASSKGGDGSSTIVQYNAIGDVQRTYTVAGEADGLKFDPNTGNVWALQNQDANATLSFINPAAQQVSAPLSYDAPYVYDASSRGFDDVAFDGKNVYLSETNPINPGDPVIVKLANGNAPFGTLETTSVLRLGDTGTNLVTGDTNQALPVTDPDSLKTLPDGSLILAGEHDAAFTIVQHPGTTQQTASFITLPAGSASPDDAIVPSATSGTLYVSNTTDNDVIAARVTDLQTDEIYASVGSSVDQIDPRTGTVTPVITGVSGAHGLLFAASSSLQTPPTVADLLQGLGNDLPNGLATDLASALGKFVSAAMSGPEPSDNVFGAGLASPNFQGQVLSGLFHTSQG